MDDYSLEKWANQNVLLLNASLSVIQSKPGSLVSVRDCLLIFINDIHKVFFIIN